MNTDETREKIREAIAAKILDRMNGWLQYWDRNDPEIQKHDSGVVADHVIQALNGLVVIPVEGELDWDDVTIDYAYGEVTPGYGHEHYATDAEAQALLGLSQHAPLVKE